MRRRSSNESLHRIKAICSGKEIMNQKVKSYLKLMRVSHYIKNGLVFAAPACSGSLFEKDCFLRGAAGFAAFSLASSAVYIMNDIRDREKDARHPTKCNRPIASGEISISNACGLVVILLIAALGCNAAVFRTSSTLLLLLYLILNLAYSFGLKNVPLADVSILTAGFIMRVQYGAGVTEISVSNWLYLTVIALAFYLSLGKRRNELLRVGSGETRTVLQFYTPGFLDKTMYMCLGLANTFYALWCTDAQTTQFYGGTSLVFTVPIVLLITMRYSMDIEGNSDGDPVEVLLHDKWLLILFSVYLAVMLFVLYFLGGKLR